MSGGVHLAANLVTILDFYMRTFYYYSLHKFEFNIQNNKM